MMMIMIIIIIIIILLVTYLQKYLNLEVQNAFIIPKNHRNIFSNFGNTRWTDLILTPSEYAHRETKDRKHYNVNKLCDP